MSNTKKRILSILLIMILLLGILPISSLAANKPMKILISSDKAFAGDSVGVTISLQNNPGISSLKLLLKYNSNILKLNSITYNNAMGGQTLQPQTMKSPVTLIWISPFKNCDLDTTFAILNFTVSKNANKGDVSAITATFDPNDIYNMMEKNVDTTITSGFIAVESKGHVHGDHNSDGKCDSCGESMMSSDLSKNCSCSCHKTGFVGLIYKIVRIFWMLFRINQTCNCGVRHY